MRRLDLLQDYRSQHMNTLHFWLLQHYSLQGYQGNLRHPLHLNTFFPKQRVQTEGFLQEVLKHVDQGTLSAPPAFCLQILAKKRPFVMSMYISIATRVFARGFSPSWAPVFFSENSRLELLFRHVHAHVDAGSRKNCCPDPGAPGHLSWTLSQKIALVRCPCHLCISTAWARTQSWPWGCPGLGARYGALLFQ